MFGHTILRVLLVPKWIWSYRNVELKDRKLRSGLTKKTLKTKFKDRDRSKHLSLSQSRKYTPQRDHNLIKAAILMINDYITLYPTFYRFTTSFAEGEGMVPLTRLGRRR